MKEKTKRRLKIAGASIGLLSAIAAPVLTAWFSSNQSPVKVGAIESDNFESETPLNRYTTYSGFVYYPDIVPDSTTNAFSLHFSNGSIYDFYISPSLGAGPVLVMQDRATQGFPFILDYVRDVNGIFTPLDEEPDFLLTRSYTFSYTPIQVHFVHPFTIEYVSTVGYSLPLEWKYDPVPEATGGYTQGYEDGESDGYAQGYGDGKVDGYDEGYDEGYDDGVVEGETHGSMTSPTGTIGGLMLTIVSVPLTILNGFQPFAVFEVPLMTILLSFLFASLVIWVIKKLV